MLELDMVIRKFLIYTRQDQINDVYITQFFSLSLCIAKSSPGIRINGCFAKDKNFKNTKILIDNIKRRKKLKVYERV